MSLDIGAIVQLPFEHIGVVVKDIDKATEFLSSIWGLRFWQTPLEYSPPKDEILVGEPFSLKFTWAKLGPVVMEVIQPLRGRSVWSQFLKAKGEGLHHIAFRTANWEEMVSRLQEQGCKMIVSGIFKGKHWCYFDTNTKPGGIILELAEQGIHTKFLQDLGLPTH